MSYQSSFGTLLNGPSVAGSETLAAGRREPAGSAGERVASWWSTLEDLLWPRKQTRDQLRRRADKLAEARVTTVIQFGFHFRFDLAWYFGAMHGLFADIADALHERGIKFLDHYSCNLIARPNSPAERVKYQRQNCHNVALCPDPIAAETAGYAGFRFNDLREIDVVTGEPAYCSYQAEMLCHNNPDFLAMHEAYLRRLLAEVPLDGLQVDDMCMYGHFRSCGCGHCRERFRREYGQELPPVTEKGFWGDTQRHPSVWGNYENPAFRQWVQMRYRTIADHLEMVKGIISRNQVLMTCCSNSGPIELNSLALSYENVIKHCDWVMLENCGLSVHKVDWSVAEPAAMLQKAIARSKSESGTPNLALSYCLYDDGAYLGWAIARFWGVTNWCSTLNAGVNEDPLDLKEEADLIGPFNRWELAHPVAGLTREVTEVRLAFLRAVRDNGWKDEYDRDYWERVRRWSLALLKRNIAYRFLLGPELEDAEEFLADETPLILDGCAHLTDRQAASIEHFLRRGGRAWIVPPLGLYDIQGQARPVSLLERLLADPTLKPSFVAIAPDHGPEALGNLAGVDFVPLIRVEGDNTGWAVRPRRQGSTVVLHVLNRRLRGQAHPTVTVRGSKPEILQTFLSPAGPGPLVVELDERLDAAAWTRPILISPELEVSRPVKMERVGAQKIRLTIPLEGIRLYAQILSHP